MTNPVISKLYELHDSWKTWKAVARQLNVSPSYLSDIVNGRREVSAQLAKKLGCRRRVEYVEDQNGRS
jgi:plasmid maintenance system antidote protein VapI